MTSQYSPTKMISSAITRSIPSLRRTISDYGLRTKSKTTEMVLHRRSESTEIVLTKNMMQSSPEFRYKLSVHGFNLLQASIAESEGMNPNSRAFSRQLYLDSLSYLLQGLPTDLSPHEANQIQNAVPLGLQNAPASITERPPPTSIKRRSILHRSLASTILFLCLVFRLFLPYIRFFLSTAYRYERTYRVTEKLFSTTMSATDSVGRKAIEVASTALGSELVLDGVAYCVDGVCGGVSEGLGKGMKAIDGKET